MNNNRKKITQNSDTVSLPSPPQQDTLPILETAQSQFHAPLLVSACQPCSTHTQSVSAQQTSTLLISSITSF